MLEHIQIFVRPFPTYPTHNVEPMYPEYFLHMNIVLGGGGWGGGLVGKYIKSIPFQ